MRAAAILLLGLTAAAVCGAGTLPDRETPVVVRPFAPGTLHAVCYGPHRDGQRPGGPGPSADQLREDLHLMAAHWSLLRIYGASEIADTLLGIIRDDEIPLRVVLGVWIAPHDSLLNAREVAAGIRLANAFPEVVAAVSVGNETQVHWSAHRSPLEALIGEVRRVRAAVAQPVTVADDFNFWNKPESRSLAAELDFVMMHAHPMWSGRRLDEALSWLDAQVREIAAFHPDRPVVLGETGWATSVHDVGEQAELIKGRPGEVEQATFYRDLRAWTERTGVTTFVFEAFDEAWKGGPHPAEVEKHWGLFRSDRSAKAALRPIGDD